MNDTDAAIDLLGGVGLDGSMAWATPQYRRSEVDRAGQILGGRIDGDRSWAVDVVDNHRATHGYPLNSVQNLVRNHVHHVKCEVLIAQRIKRLSSITKKLENQSTMQLRQMQDIGGCRAVVQTPEQAYVLRGLMEKSNTLHELRREKDYIKDPKVSGYRGIHRIYECHGRAHPEYDGLFIEVQIRSQLQHVWSTAVETVGAVLGDALKSSEGQDNWLRFFALMGSAMARREGAARVPGTPSAHRKLRAELRDCARELDVVDRLAAYHTAVSVLGGRSAGLKKAKYFLLQLDRTGEKPRLNVSPYLPADLALANEAYADVERTKVSSDFEAVLVSVDSLQVLKRAYPNYYMDTAAFLNALRREIS